MIITGELDRKITVAQEIVKRLDSNQPLSSALSQVRLLANMTGDTLKIALIDILTHGLLNVPYQGIPFTDPTYKAAGLLHVKLCSMEDTTKLDINEIVDEMKKGQRSEKIPIKNQVVTLSVYEMENQTAPPMIPWDSHEMTNLIFQVAAAHDRIKSILITLRAYIYDYVSNIWIEATREKDRIALLGPDYRFITNKLESLETSVGSELLAAVDNLCTNNPANWNLCALGCRNVILKLGTILWQVPEQTYVTQSGETLAVKKDKEKNRLYAYIDARSKGLTRDKQALLDEAQGLVGSKGKREIRHADAQELVVDTFRFIDLLDESTDLKPIDTLS